MTKIQYWCNFRNTGFFFHGLLCPSNDLCDDFTDRPPQSFHPARGMKYILF